MTVFPCFARPDRTHRHFPEPHTTPHTDSKRIPIVAERRRTPSGYVEVIEYA